MTRHTRPHSARRSPNSTAARQWAWRGLTCSLAVASALTAFPAMASASTDDPYRSDQWAFDSLHLDAAHERSTGCDTTIAIVDSGVDLDHPELSERIVPGIDLIDDDGNPDDENGHGTHVAGIAAASADNGIGIAGAAPCASIMPVRALDADGAGDDATIAEGIVWAADHGADVINLSLGESGFIGRLRAGGALNDAITEAHEKGAVVVAATGNDGTPRIRNYELDVPVILVGAIAEGDEPAEFSNFGDPRTLVAPGESILSTMPEDGTTIFPEGTDGYAYLDGTSMAAPYASGVAALLVSQGHGADEVERIMYETARDGGDDPRLGAGIIDAEAAAAQGPVAPRVEFDGEYQGDEYAWSPWIGSGLAAAILIPGFALRRSARKALREEG